MFGYIIPDQQAMTPEARWRYRTAYCGLCRRASALHGMAGRLTLSYDLTFLNLLLGKYEYQGSIRSSVGFDYFPYPVRDGSLPTREVLSQVYGKSYGFINVASSEFQEEHMVQRFLGAPPGYVGHGTSNILLEPVRSNPYHVILIDEIDLPIIVDAGIGRPSQACEAMEMGAAAVMANTAIATAGNVPLMAEAFRKAIEAGRGAYLSGLGRVMEKGASPSSPLTGYLQD